MKNKTMIAIVLIIVVVCVGIGILSFYGSGSLNNNNNNNNSTNEEEYPESSEYIGKEKAIEIFNNRDPSNTIELSVTAGSVLPEREDIIIKISINKINKYFNLIIH